MQPLKKFCLSIYIYRPMNINALLPSGPIYGKTFISISEGIIKKFLMSAVTYELPN